MALTAVEIKRFFKKNYGIPVRCETGKSFTAIRIVPNKTERHTDPLTYPHRFPNELGNLCMRIVYKGSPGLEAQTWGGNIGAHSLAMSPTQWLELVAAVEKPAG